MTEHLTTDSFKTKVYDFEKNTQWAFAGDRPAIVDFWAEWCPPCKMISPVLDEIATTYGGKLNVYKVNSDEQPDVAAVFGITSIPTLLFIPMNEKPQMTVGALPKSGIVKLIKDVLKVE